ncbi:hypothetical protein [Nonomuraea rubra]|uniref:hypothetical protein n=1 Tax=Nonomuraea rubra TaxID=46180 RepID=UPI0031E62044
MPNEIRVVPGIPRTLSGRSWRCRCGRSLLGTPVEDAANPDAMAIREVLRHFTP